MRTKAERPRATHHAAESLAGSERPDDQRDVQVGVDPPALVATLQTAHVVLQLALVQLVDQVGLAEEEGGGGPIVTTSTSSQPGRIPPATRQ